MGVRGDLVGCLIAVGIAYWGIYGAPYPSNEDELSTCHSETEPVLLLRQLNLSPDQKTTFQACTVGAGLSKDECEASFLNANHAIEDCMGRHGRDFLTYDLMRPATCHWDSYNDPICYEPSWRMGIKRFISNLGRKAG